MGFKNGEVQLSTDVSLPEIEVFVEQKVYIYDSVVDPSWGITIWASEEVLLQKAMNFIELFTDYYSDPVQFKTTWEKFIKFCFKEIREHDPFSDYLKENLSALYMSTNGNEFRSILNSLAKLVVDFENQVGKRDEAPQCVIPRELREIPSLELWAHIYIAEHLSPENSQWTLPTEECIEYNGSKIYVQFIAGKIAQLQVKYNIEYI